MPLHINRRVLAVKAETTIGTAETLASGDGAFNAQNVSIQASIDVEDRQAQGSFNRLSGVPGARMGTISFTTDIGWDGTATMPTWASVLFPACGVVESTQVYTPRSESPGSNVKTVTIAAYEDGLRKQLSGAVGTFVLNLPSGRMASIDWTFTGVFNAVADVALIAPTYPTAAPLRFADATLTYDSVAQIVESVTLDIGNEVVMRESAATAAGYISGIITGRRPTVTMNPESRLVANDDRFGDWLAANEAALSIVLDGPTDSTITIAAPKAQIVNVQEGDRNGIQVDDVEFTLNKNAASADQEFSITFAEAT